MYFLIEDENELITAFEVDRIKKVSAFKSSKETDKFRIMLETDFGGCLVLDKFYDDWAEAKEDMLMLILGIEEINAPRIGTKDQEILQMQHFSTPERTIEYARTRLGKQRKTKEEKENAEHRMRI